MLHFFHIFKMSFVNFTQALDGDMTHVNSDSNYIILNTTIYEDIFEIDPNSGIISIIGELDVINGPEELYLYVGVENTAPPYLTDNTVVFVNVTLKPEVKAYFVIYSYFYCNYTVIL